MNTPLVELSHHLILITHTDTDTYTSENGFISNIHVGNETSVNMHNAHIVHNDLTLKPLNGR